MAWRKATIDLRRDKVRRPPWNVNPIAFERPADKFPG